jgi:hypothetical protein
MDLEILGEEFAEAEKEADTNHWIACEVAFRASNSGRSEWAWMLSKFSGKSDDQIRNRRNAYSMYLHLLAETELAEEFREALYFSHFTAGFKYITDAYRLVEIFAWATDEQISVRKFGATLDDLFGDDPESRFIARYGRFNRELEYIYGVSEYNKVPQKVRRAMILLRRRIEQG